MSEFHLEVGLLTLFNSRLYKFAENGMSVIRAALEFRMILNTDIEAVGRYLHSLNKKSVGRSSCKYHAVFLKIGTEFIIELITVTVTL